ncbi:MAG: hypothetical protein Q9220_003422 [cf. Caloplaca sp. 1 TL-2023]
MDLLADNFPQIFHLYSTYCHPYTPYLAPLHRFLLLTESYFFRYFFPALYPFFALGSRLFTSLLTESPSLASLALLAVLALVILKLMDMLRRTIVYWISLAVRLAVYGGVVGVGMWVYQRGVEQSVEDLGWVVGLLAGLGEQGERVGHAKAAGRARQARNIPKGSGRGRTRGAGW